MTGSDGRPAVFGARLATGVAALAAAALAVAVGHPLLAGVAVVGPVAIRWGVGQSHPTDEERIARASAGLAVGAVLVAATFQVIYHSWPTLLAVVAPTVGASLLAFDLGNGVWAEERTDAAVALLVSTVVAGLVTVAVAVVSTGTALAIAVGTGRVIVAATRLPATTALALLLVALGTFGSLFWAALSTLERWLPPRRYRRYDPPGWVDTYVPRVTELPRWYGGLVLAAWLATAPSPTTWITGVVGAVPVAGPAVLFVLRSGLLLGLVGLPMAVLGAIVAASAVEPVVRTALGRDPATRLASAAGGAAVSLRALGLTAVPPVGRTLARWTALQELTATAGSGVVALLGVCGGLLAGLVVVATLAFPSSLIGSVGRLVAVGLLLAGGIATAPAGAPLWVTTVGVVAAVLAWDLSAHAVELGRQVGAVDARRATTTHATASVAVGAGALALVLAASAVGPVRLPRGDPRATLALSLLFVAVVSLAWGLGRSS